MSGQSGYLVSGAYENLVPVPIYRYVQTEYLVSGLKSCLVSALLDTGTYSVSGTLFGTYPVQKEAGYPVSEKVYSHPSCQGFPFVYPQFLSLLSTPAACAGCQLPKYKLLGHGLLTLCCCIRSSTIQAEVNRLFPVDEQPQQVHQPAGQWSGPHHQSPSSSVITFQDLSATEDRLGAMLFKLVNTKLKLSCYEQGSVLRLKMHGKLGKCIFL